MLLDGDDDQRAVGAVLGLGAEVERRPLGVGVVAGDQHQLRGSGEESIPTSPETARFASRTQALPGPAIDVDRDDRLGPVGEGEDRLGAAHRVDLLDPAERGGGEHQPGAGCPSGPGGEARAMRSTPATRAGIAHISTLEG